VAGAEVFADFFAGAAMVFRGVWWIGSEFAKEMAADADAVPLFMA
jgi:hypothetical protein